MNLTDKFNIKGRLEIIDNNTGKKILDAKNLVLLISRAAILQVMFNDDKVMEQVSASASGIIPTKFKNTNFTVTDGYKRIICGFVFGHNGCELNTNPAIVRVPSPQDVAKISENPNNTFDDFLALPMINLIGSGSDTKILNTSGSYENLSEINNNYIYENNTVKETVSNGSLIKYFNLAEAPTDTTDLYCKAFDTNFSTTTIDPYSSEIDYKIKLDVDNYDLIGQTFSELGLVMADCKVTNGIITEIKSDTAVLATRLTFDPISLSSQLLSQFSLYYHIYI